jgi:vitamin B12 transporter
VRGAEGEQLLVLIDGVRMADPAAPGGGFDFGTLLAGNLAKIELQRSSNSTIWGSERDRRGARSDHRRQRTTARRCRSNTARTISSTATGQVQVGTHYDSHARCRPVTSTATDSRPPPREPSRRVPPAELGADGKLESSTRSDRGDAALRRGRPRHRRLPAPDFVLADTAETQETRQLSARRAGYRTNLLDLACATRCRHRARLFDPALGTAPSFATDGTSNASRRADACR